MMQIDSVGCVLAVDARDEMKNGYGTKTSQFLKLLGESSRQINSYIFSLVSNFEDAKDISQQTIETMWQKFDDFEIGTDFACWGVKIAHYKILGYRRKLYNERIFFCDSIFKQIDEVAQKRSGQADERLKYLRDCVKKLAPSDMVLLRNRYELNHPVKSLASRSNKSEQYIYRQLAKINRLLYHCIRRNMVREGS
jgi:RNA polymerase sigma-70 factor (ECF subfamily)